ncbi:MAG: glutamate--tRNA ligase [Proteobacteria bacterium]|nr:MAG: glutamate--tRNA ligase [Pseudomonadota bacterium]
MAQFDLQKTLRSSGPQDGKVRVRFAPSPTGYLHVGGARTHLFNWLAAKHLGGTLVLRVEDTDQVRYTPESEKLLLQDISALGLDPDEGPIQGGPCAPYRQSERQELFKHLAYKLLDEGKAFRCFCSDAEVTEKALAAKASGKPPHYDGTCTMLSAEESLARSKTESFSLRLKAPFKDYTCHDLLRGEVTFKAGMAGDFVILRSSGMPIYNFAVVIDDYYMGITHIIRGEDHLSNTIRQLIVYEAFGWKLPEFAHISMILGTDKKKLSKRDGASSVTDYLRMGYLPEALVNFLALLGWSPSDGKEVRPLQEIVDSFELSKLNKSPAVFDDDKLAWMNGEYIKAMDVKELAERIRPFVEKAGYDQDARGEEWFLNVLSTVRGGLRLLSEIGPHLEIYYADRFGFEEDARAMLGTPEAKKVVQAFREEVAAAGGVSSEEALAAIQNKVKEKSGQKGKNLFMPMRASVTGKLHGPELKLVMPLLGAEETLRRIDQSLSL